MADYCCVRGRLRMKRLLGLLGPLLVFAASCGTHQSPPSVSIKAASVSSDLRIVNLDFTDPDASSTNKVWVYNVLPSSGPSGELALVSVHDGRVKTLRWPLSFQGLQRPGMAAVLVNGNLIEASFLAGVRESAPSVISEKTQGGGFWGTHIVVRAGQQQVFWIANRYAGPVEDEHEWNVWSLGSHLGLSDLVTFSKRIPSMTSYCLTVSVEKASS